MVEGIMNEKMREKKLDEIKQCPPIMTGVRLNYQGEDCRFNVYRIPLKFLVYNPYNGRIGTKVKTFEARNYQLNPENEEDVKIIESYLWESNTERNKKTKKNLIQNGQREYGIVSKNGIIIDGNRRASIMNKIVKEYSKSNPSKVEHCQFFDAIILDDTANKKDILKLETTYQMGQDEKLDYNAPEKYLKCKELMEQNFSIDEIADMMGEKKGEIQKYLEILDLMDLYLKKYDYIDMYSMLEKREGPFVDLRSYVSAYEKNRGKANWSVEESDISELLDISFDYIRAKYEGKDFRNIGKPMTSKGIPQSFFSDEKTWEKFKNKHYDEVETIEEDSVDNYLEKKSVGKDINVVLNNRDDEWIKKSKNILIKNMKIYGRVLDDIQAAETPAILLRDILNSLDLIDTSQESFYSKDVYEKICDINSTMYEFKKIYKKGKKDE